MKSHFFVSRALMLTTLLGCCLFSFSQSPTAKTYHHWHTSNSGIKLPAATESEYKGIPQADYTPAQNIKEWGAEKQLKDFAAGITGRLTATFIFNVDETGYVRKIRTVKTDDAKNAAALAAILVNTKISGPSFIHNEAVASYVPCSISLSKNQITIL